MSISSFNCDPISIFLDQISLELISVRTSYMSVIRGLEGKLRWYIFIKSKRCCDCCGGSLDWVKYIYGPVDYGFYLWSPVAIYCVFSSKKLHIPQLCSITDRDCVGCLGRLNVKSVNIWRVSPCSSNHISLQSTHRVCYGYAYRSR
jgi:hypothetical protein